MAKYKDILGNIRECEDKTITISLERYNTLIIKEAITDGFVELKEIEKKRMIKGRKVYDPLTNTYSTGWWIVDDNGNYYPVW